MTQNYDAIVIGAGHNGLVAANYLARAGRKVLVLESRDVVGGACVTEELIPGAKWSSAAFVAGLIRPEVIDDLELEKFGFEMYPTDALGFSLFADGSHLFIWPEIDRTLREIERYSRRDARRFLEFGARLRRFGDFMRPWLLSPPPSHEEVVRAFEEAGERRLYEEFFVMSTRELLDSYFENEHIKGFFTFFGMVSTYGGPATPGTGYVYGYHASGEFQGHFGLWGYVKGGMGGFTQALANAARHFGATVRTGTPVARVMVRDGAVSGVALESGEQFFAPTVLSNADPKRSLLKMVEPEHLDPTFRERVEGIDQRGSMARVHLLIDELPAYLGLPPGEGPQHHAHQMLGASVGNFEKAWEAERRGEIADDYCIEAVIQSTTDPTLAPPGLHTLTLGVQQLPTELARGTWDDIKESWGDKIVDILCRYAPNLRGHILDRVVLTPKDWEDDWSLTGGNIFHAAMFDPQVFDQRPLPELARYATPIRGYYLCGAGTHPGGGVMGAPGHNAAQTVLADLGLKTKPIPQRDGRLTGAAVVDRILRTEAGGRVAYRLARHKAFRPFAGLATRVKGGGTQVGG